MEAVWVLNIDGEVEYHRTLDSVMVEIKTYDVDEIESISVERHAVNDDYEV